MKNQKKTKRERTKVVIIYTTIGISIFKINENEKKKYNNIIIVIIK